MKISNKILTLSAILAILIAIAISCSKDDQSPEYTYYISKELSVTYTKSYITSLISLVSGSIPDVNSLKSFVKSDVKIYKIVYKTTINGEKIDASGVVCVPADQGEYPVLSFQNGTNTLNASAPSESANSSPYQLIEIIASMGYIVVIADYPGFGKSIQVPHPYLVTEPTVRSLTDMFFAVKELTSQELPGIAQRNEYYLLGYSQGGHATLALHKALELEYSKDFNLVGSACGAGPYNINLLMQGMLTSATYPMPVYLGYILNAYTAYNQFSNPVTDIFNEPYASRVNSLYKGLLTSDQINSQLTKSIPLLITADFLSGFSTSQKYLSVRQAFDRNSIAAWHSYVPLLLIHGAKDSQVSPVSTENMYTTMIQAGTSADICKKVIVPDLDHSDGAAPCLVKGFLFLNNLNVSK
jgi:pimeloyl-ACP methyl ester carboxylesterase